MKAFITCVPYGTHLVHFVLIINNTEMETKMADPTLTLNGLPHFDHFFTTFVTQTGFNL